MRSSNNDAAHSMRAAFDSAFSGRTRWERAGLVGLLATTILAPQLLGGATGETRFAIVTVSAIVSALSAWALLPKGKLLGQTPYLVLAPVLAAAWTAVELIPVDCGIVQLTHPERILMDAQLHVLDALPARRCSLTTAPGAARLAFTLALSMFGISSVAAGFAKQGARPLLTASIGVGSVLSAFVALAHAAANAQLVFGLYAPKEARPGLLLGPLLNGNHLAGHLALGFPITLHWALAARNVERRILAWLCAGTVLCANVLTLSRGGIGALAAGGLGFIAWRTLGRRRRRRSTISWSTALTASAIGTGTAVGLSGALVLAFPKHDWTIDKLRSSFGLMDLAWEHPLFGIGRGALPDLSPRLVDGTQWVLYAENVVVQWSVDWGLPFAMVMFATLGLGASRLRLRRAQDAAMCCGFAALALQNLVDFSLELPGIAMVGAMALGLLGSQERPNPLVPLASMLRVTAVATTLCAAVAPWAVRHIERSELLEALEAALDGPTSQYRTALSRALAMYPLDPAILTTAARKAVRADVPSAPRWLNASMTSAQSWGAPHVLAAEYLTKHQRFSQAATELSIAADLAPEEWRAASCWFASLSPTADYVFEAAGQGGVRTTMLSQLASCLEQRRELLLAFAQLWLSESPNETPPALALLRAQLLNGDLALTIAGARKLLDHKPALPQALSMLMEALSRSGQPKQALDAFRASPTAVRNDLRVLQNAAAAAAAAKDRSALDEALGVLVSVHGSSTEVRAQLEAFCSEQYQTLGDPHTALAHALRAYGTVPSLLHAERVFSTASAANREQVKLRMAQELCHARFRGEAYCTSSRNR